MRQSADTLDERYSDQDLRSAWARLYALHHFWAHCILPPDYAAPATVTDAVSLTEAGEGARAWLADAFPGTTDADRLAVIATKVGHHDLLVDPLATDGSAMQGLLADEIRSGRLRFPALFGRGLYDKFFEAFNAEPDELSSEQTQTLLRDTDQGVCQMGAFVAGPFGLLVSETSRVLPPVTRVPLSHCSDPGCLRLHKVQLRSADVSVVRMYSALAEHLSLIQGPQSDWSGLWLRVIRQVDSDPSYYADFNATGLVSPLGNAFSDAELRRLTERILDKQAADMRPRLPTSLTQAAGGGSAAAIAGTLKRGEALQLLLISTDENLVLALEHCIDEGIILIPRTEVRHSRFSFRHLGGWADQHPTCSRLGVRFSSGNSVATARVKALLKALYSSFGNLADLEWQLMDAPGETVSAKLDHLVHNSSPRELIKEFTMARKTDFDSTTEYLTYGHFPVPTSREEREFLVDRVLWKLGFRVAEYPDDHATFWRHLALVREVLGARHTSEAIRIERTRSAAVNLFVALEQVLERSLAFIVWALTSDHWGAALDTRFLYSLAPARARTAEILAGRDVGNGRPLAYESDGSTNLFGIVEGFRLAAVAMQELVDGDWNRYARPENQRPRFAGKSGIELFPFDHTVALLDLEDSAVREIVQVIETVYRLLTRGNVMATRNDIPHPAEDFPTIEQINTSLLASEEAITLLEGTGATPLVWHRGERVSDEFGRTRAELCDYQGRSHWLNQPSELHACFVPASSTPQVVFKLARIHGSSEVLRFRFEEPSDYTDMYANWPRRPKAREGRPEDGILKRPETADSTVDVDDLES